MNREEALERAIELRDHSAKFESVSFLESDTEFFDYVIKELERTAQEVPVQEQLKTILGNDITIFVKDEGSNCYEAEIADSRNRIKLLNIELRKVSKSRYCVTDYQSF
ncbi:Uncharacterised protein [uncultured Clostridium sp.]|uniref:hypothetical protein n=1 Tax=uncultured Clostridium sp. TaxID=59620 RepID=UPI0008214027|nr:hypothetical protein [uncultured Clostridium sp.]SCJ08604.1 Uncharacterised protein [uncultured Clostridium sp.]